MKYVAFVIFIMICILIPIAMILIVVSYLKAKSEKQKVEDEYKEKRVEQIKLNEDKIPNLRLKITEPVEGQKLSSMRQKCWPFIVVLFVILLDRMIANYYGWSSFSLLEGICMVILMSVMAGVASAIEFKIIHNKTKKNYNEEFEDKVYNIDDYYRGEANSTVPILLGFKQINATYALYKRRVYENNFIIKENFKKIKIGTIREDLGRFSLKHIFIEMEMLHQIQGKIFIQGKTRRNEAYYKFKHAMDEDRIVIPNFEDIQSIVFEDMKKDYAEKIMNNNIQKEIADLFIMLPSSDLVIYKNVIGIMIYEISFPTWISEDSVNYIVEKVNPIIRKLEKISEEIEKI